MIDDGDQLLADPCRPLDTNREAMQVVAADARKIYQQGGRLSNWQQKALREAAFYELEAVVWQDRAALAADVKRWTGQTYNALDKAKCPWNSHGPTPKVPVLEWLVERQAIDIAALRRRAVEHQVSAKREREIEIAKLRRMKAKADIEETQAVKARETLQDEAADVGRKTVVELTTQLRRTLVDEAPAAIAAAIVEKKLGDVAAIERAIRSAVENALQQVNA